jgi:excinuclease ABC subunit B
MVMTLRVGDKMGQRDVIAHLIRMQYTRNETDFSRGTFRVRGDTIDVFPAEHSELAMRIELFDDEVEALQLLRPADRAHPAEDPALHGLPEQPLRDAARARARGHRDDQAGAARAPGRVRQAAGKLVEAQRLEQRTRFDLEMLQEVGHCKGIENYTRHLSGARRASRRRRWWTTCRATR